MIHRNLLTQCMFLPVEQPGEETREEVVPDTAEDWEMESTADIEEQTGEAARDEVESDSAEDWGVDRSEEIVESTIPGTTNGQEEHTGVEEVSVEAGQMSEGREETGTAGALKSASGPSASRRNLLRNQRLPQRLSYESQVNGSEEDRQKIARGWRLWQRAKARRAAGHM